jgi:predicted transcriptional regulator
MGASPARKVDVEVAVSMYLRGATQREIAKKLGCSDVAVGNFLRKDHRTAHLTGRKGVAVKLRWGLKLAEAKALRLQGKTQRETATALGVSQAWVSKIER